MVGVFGLTFTGLLISSDNVNDNIRLHTSLFSEMCA